MDRSGEQQRTAMIEVISFLFFTLFAMIIAFFTSAKVFAAPHEGPAPASAPAAIVAPAPRS